MTNRRTNARAVILSVPPSTCECIDSQGLQRLLFHMKKYFMIPCEIQSKSGIQKASLLSLCLLSIGYKQALVEGADVVLFRGFSRQVITRVRRKDFSYGEVLRVSLITFTCKRNYVAFGHDVDMPWT